MAEDKTVKSSDEKELVKRDGHYFYANGKRKTSVARIRLYENGKGEIIVNDKPINEYFFGELIVSVKAPLKIANALKLFDITAFVEGGGVSSQADAVRHGISKALLEYDPELRSQLKKAGFLTRDSRTKERKKPGLKRARRAPQWAKR
ncbi:MAG: 30S ribosomal protein S9 [Patescibacteria group bacterium]|nr:30S ribosomal protein S9 [Patescibacteria group bacterium]MBU1016456.1 30S ribosomal protein S9 [Patescibacteria group bacterium]MBU1684954.1 30S ribosomal protein S9 [Patescibacteria group bacterium]MBU1939018.1 30S ribosomal protein S9 [Patescibacteria group bacterium]